ncbi:MAG: GH1 family beta-glucosidase, partial [Nitratireductor sp.]
MDKQIKRLPEDFVFGVATSSYQIEGTQFGNCGRSHWDDFADKPNKVYQNENGLIACDHYNRWAQDLDLVKDAGFDAYRFSFAWPRILPENNKDINQEGIAFYDRLIDGMLERGLDPVGTLYHCDLPSRLANNRRWTSRETPPRFGDYTDLVMNHFKDRLETIAPINEPWCAAWLSHYLGAHAPGLQDISAAAKAMHYIQLAHGLSIEVMRGHSLKNLGCVVNKEFAVPVDDSEEAKRLANLHDGIYNRWFDDSLFKGHYPKDVLELLGEHLPKNYEEDMPIISQELDWIGINYYTRAVIAPDPNEPHIGYKLVSGELTKTDMGWEIEPEGLSFFLRRFANEYAPNVPIYITENGMANKETITPNGINDVERISYFQGHLEQVANLVEDGVPIAGYFAWSLLDNYEWAFGYDKRFGIVHVDFETLERTPKQSYLVWQAALNNA